MALENDVKDLLRLASEHDDRAHWEDITGISAQRLADGIERSGLRQEIRTASEAHQSALLSLAFTMGAGMQSISAAVAKQSELVANPEATAADELHRRGAFAYSRGWFDEAIADLSGSLERNPYDPRVHLLLGLTLHAAGRPAEAVQPFERVVRYARQDHRALAAQGLLLAAGTRIELDDERGAHELLAREVDSFRDCPEVLQQLADLDDEPVPLLVAAFRRAPELAVPALVAGIDGAFEAIEQLSADPESPVTAIVAIGEKLEALRADWDVSFDAQIVLAEIASRSPIEQFEAAATVIAEATAFSDGLRQELRSSSLVREADPQWRYRDLAGPESHHDIAARRDRLVAEIEEILSRLGGGRLRPSPR